MGTSQKKQADYVALHVKTEARYYETDKALKIVNTLRGFPNGFCLLKYPCEADCERASPGLIDAQRRAVQSQTICLDARMFLDKDGRPSYEIIRPEGVTIKIVDG